MAGRGVCDTRCQSFYTEMLEKEHSLRIKWFLKNQQRLLDHLEKTKLSTETRISPLTADQLRKQPTADIIHLKPLPNWRPPESDGSIDINIMKPINPEVRAILYEKSVPSFITADNYILERAKESPENRYFFPDCTSWIYGWHLNHYPPVPRSKVGMKSVMITEFYHPRVSSLQRDPEWYRPCQSKAKNVDILTD